MKYLATLVSLLFIASCDTGKYEANFPEISFKNLPKYKIDAASMEFVESETPFTQKEVEFMLSHAHPVDMLKKWVKERVDLVGHNRKFKFVINNIDITRQYLPKKHQGIDAPFYKEQTESYKAVLDVSMIIESDAPNYEKASFEVEIERKMTLAEDTPPLMREQALHMLVKNLMEDFNKRVDENMLKFLGEFVYQN